MLIHNIKYICTLIYIVLFKKEDYAFYIGIMYNLESTGLKIKEIRKRKKISQEKLAEMVSMNTRSILRLENAQNIPTIETLDKIAKALNVSIADFFETQTTKNKDEIIEDINKCLLTMNIEELKNFYKAVYYFIH